MKLFYFLTIIIFFPIITACNKKFIYDSKITVPLDYIISKQELKFHFNDSVFQCIIYIKPNGEFSPRLKENDSISSYISPFFSYNSLLFSLDTGKTYKKKEIWKKDSILELDSYFPLLMKHDSSLVNHYPDKSEFDGLSKLSYEPYYSYLLNLTNEPRLNSRTAKQIIRIASAEEYSKLTDKPKKRFTLRFEQNNDKEAKLFYTEGQFDSIANFIIIKNDSCIVSEREIFKINQALNKIDLNKEYYFCEEGLDISQKFLFEYKTEDNYYILQRALFNKYHNNIPFINMYYLLLGIKTKYLKN